MRFSLKQLRYFDAALRNGSIAKAAIEVNISQSSITAAIDAIEQSTGTDLFRRIPAKGILPTEAGRIAGERIAMFLEQARTFESDLMSLAGEPEGTLHLGCYAPTAPFVLPPLLKRISEVYPSIRIDLREGDLDSMVDLLHHGAVDMALTYRRMTPETMPFLPMFRARPWVLLPDVSPLAAKAGVEIKELAALPMIMLDLPATKTYFMGLFQKHNITPNVVHSTKSSSVLRGLVAANFGYSLLNICGPADRHGKSGYVAKPLLGEVDAPQFGMAFTSLSKRSKLVQVVLDICTDLAARGAYQDLILPETA